MLKRRSFPVVLLVAAAIGAGCEKVPLLAPTSSTISVSAQTTVLPPGGSTEISATVVESGGTPVHNGTLVRFSASLGRVEPAEVETRGGIATTRFIAGTESGTARIRATSGAASGGEGDTAANVVTIAIGGAAAAALTVSASPARVGPSGGSVTMIASALDASGNRLVGVPITFSTTSGTLSASSASSDSNGEARVTLTTNREATVTARTGNQSATATVTVATAGTVTLATTPAAPLSGQAVTLTVTPAAGTSPRVVVSWGDGTTEDLGIVAAVRSATHVYQRAGFYTITATSTADGETFTTSISVSIGSGAGLTLDGPTPASPFVGSPVSFTVKAAAGTTPRVVIDWGDGSSTDLGTVNGDRSAVHTYTQAGTYIVTATATAAGDTFSTSKAVTVSALAPLSVSVSPSGNRPSCSPVTFTASVTPANASITSYRWSIASNVSSENEEPPPQASSQLSRTFAAGAKTVTVTATASDGRTGTGQTNITCP